VARDGQSITLPPVTPAVSVGQGRRGLGAGVDIELDRAVIAAVETGSSADKAGLQPGSTILSINDTPVASWHDVRAAMKSATPDKPMAITVQESGSVREIQFTPTANDVSTIAGLNYITLAAFDVHQTVIRADSPWQAMVWGVGETRDLILKGYLTLKRVAYDRSVPASNLVGIVGIFHSGTLFADKGWDWYVWFLAMVSANLAVVNFLPIPVVDGGLFCFLLLEKLTGRPPSQKLQVAAQMVGLVLILSLFLFVTYNDVMRIFTS
jgi:regulator of sigma E protease